MTQLTPVLAAGQLVGATVHKLPILCKKARSESCSVCIILSNSENKGRLPKKK